MLPDRVFGQTTEIPAMPLLLAMFPVRVFPDRPMKGRPWLTYALKAHHQASSNGLYDVRTAQQCDSIDTNARSRRLMAEPRAPNGMR
jgi:hypothetical protein